MVKTDHKNFTSFLTIKELNQRQVKQAEMLAEYYFKIEYVKELDNAKTDALSRKEKLQKNNKMSETLFKKIIMKKLGTIIHNCQKHIKH